MASQPITMSNQISGKYTSAFSGITDISDRLSAISSPAGNVGNTFGDFKINIPIEHVEDYNDFVSQLQKDKQFENMILSMTVDRILGKSSLAKNKYQWKS